MNRIVVWTVAMLVAVVGFAMMGEDQEATAGLFKRGGGGCCQPACCEPAPQVCCEPVCGGRKHKCGGGLFSRMRGRKCHKADCCEPVSCCAPAPTCCAPEPTCCAPQQSCGCEAACGCGSQGCGCEAAAPCGCDGGQMSGGMPYQAPMAPEAAPEAPQAPEAPAAPEAPQGDAST